MAATDIENRSRNVTLSLTDYHLSLIDAHETNRSEAVRRLIESEYAEETVSQ